MRKVFNHRLFDTDTAELVAHEQYSEPQDAHYYHIDLFRTPKGSWFEEIEGGALGIYGQHVGCTHYSSHELLPLSEAEAQNFIARNADADTYLRFWTAEEA